MQTSQQLSSSHCSLEGNLFLPFQIQQVFAGKNILQSPDDYQIPKGVTLKEECSRAFNIARAEWGEFVKFTHQQNLDDTVLLQKTTHFILQFFKFGLGYNIQECAPIFVPYIPGEQTPEDRTFPVTHLANDIPLAIVSSAHTLDKRHPHVTYTNGDIKLKTPFQIIQELINGKDEFTWGFVCNGLTLRLVHKAIALTRPCYIEFNLEAIFNTGDYAEFFLMWELLHASRTNKDLLGDNIWDRWVKESVNSGQPARDALGYNLEQALIILGNGFLQTPGNEHLVEAIKNNQLTANDFQHQLLQLIYRFMFVFTLEERHILSIKAATEANALARSRYEEGYAFHRFINPSRKLRFQNDFIDAWESVQIVFKSLDKGEELLAIPALGGLFFEDRCQDLCKAKLANRYFYQAMEKMRWAKLNGVLTTIDYKNMGTEELGSIYEGLLELIPQIDLANKTFTYLYATGNERKSSGSYYTPDFLVQNLIKSTLDPVIEQKLNDNPFDMERALLSLSVIDPACGSGHFLLAAARRIADKLAEVRAGNESVTPELYRKSLHDVIQNCIFGVDLNPMAIELTKISLWLEGFAENTPMSFLDHHIKHGNALFGIYDLNMVKLGIPNVAYDETDKELESEFRQTNKDVCSRLKSQNTKECKDAQKQADTLVALPLFTNINPLDLDPKFNQASEREKEDLYAKYLALVQSNPEKIACDLYIAAFLAPKTNDFEQFVPTSLDIFKQLYAKETLTPDDFATVQKATELCQKHHIFHWLFEFPEQCQEGKGFDCVLGNPPWEKPKMEDKKWFASRIPTITNADTAAKRKSMIQALASGTYASKYLNAPESDELKLSEKNTYLQYAKDKYFFTVFGKFGHLKIQELGRFTQTGSGDTNLYSYFAELANNIRSKKGSAGLVLPAGIITDDSTKAFSSNILSTGQIQSAYHFYNTENIFKDVDGRYSFILLTLMESSQADFVFFATNIKHLEDQKRHVKFEPTDLKLFNPNTQTCILTRTNDDLKLCRKIYQNSTVLRKVNDADGNPWQMQTLSLFHMSNDSSLFYNVKNSDNLVPLYEGKMFNQFDHRFGMFDQNLSDFRLLTQAEKQQSSFLCEPQYWIDGNEVNKKLSDRKWNKPWMLAWRNIASPTNERSLILSVLSAKVGMGNSATILLPNVKDTLAACLLATLNSLVIDFVDRIKQNNANLNLFILEQLPVLPPEAYSVQDIEFICERVAKLTRTADDINAVWLTDYPEYTFQNPEERLRIRAELDAYIARKIGLSRIHFNLSEIEA